MRQIQPEEVDPDLIQFRKILKPKELKALEMMEDCDWVREKDRENQSPRPYVWREIDYLNRRFGITIYAYACLRMLGKKYSEEEKATLQKTRKGRRELRNNKPRYEFLYWYRYANDLPCGKGVVPISRVLAFFPSA